MKTTPIGAIELGVDGKDAYSRIELDDADLEAIGDGDAADWVHAQAMQKFSFDCRGPGTVFLNLFTVLPFPSNERAFVLIAHVRRDC
jgi:hypothetical protein